MGSQPLSHEGGKRKKSVSCPCLSAEQSSCLLVLSPALLLILFSGLQVHFSWPGGAKWGKAPWCTQHTVTLRGLLSPWTVALPDGDSVWVPHAMVLRYRALCWLLTRGICNCPKAGRSCWMQSWDPPVPWGQVKDPGLCWWHFHPLFCLFSPDLPSEHPCCCPHRATAARQALPTPPLSQGCRSVALPAPPEQGVPWVPLPRVTRGSRCRRCAEAAAPRPAPRGCPWVGTCRRAQAGAFKRERRGGAVSPHINLS